jgi:NADH:ubiquinone reductase (non-electrogenic)
MASMASLAPLATLGPLFYQIVNLEPYPKPKKELLVVGYGWGADAFLNRIDTDKYSVRVVSSRTARLDQPYMISALTSSGLAPSTVGYKGPILNDTCHTIDASTNTILCDHASHKYDILVVAMGSEMNDFRIPGVRDFCRPFKTEVDLQSLRDQIPTKTAAVVMGAGPTGIELACKLRSMGLTVSIVEAGEQILPGFSAEMKKRTQQILNENDIAVYSHHPITAVTKDTIVTKKGTIPHSADSDLLIWTCGVQPVAPIRKFTGGRPFQVDGNLKVIGSENIYALGDVITGRGPPTAQAATQQGAYLASYLNGTAIYDFTYKEKGRILDLTYGHLIEIAGISFYLPANYFQHVTF